MAENTENQEINSHTKNASSIVGETHNPFAEHEEYSSNWIQEKILPDAVTSIDEPIAKSVVEAAAVIEEKLEDTISVDPLEWLNEQWRSEGLKFESLNDIPKLVKSYNDLLTKSKSQDLTPEEKTRIKIARETGDWTLYDRVSTIDTQSITAVDALKAKLILENPKLPPSIIDKKFEADLNARMAHYDEDLAAELLKVEGNEAKAWLDAKKQSMKPAEDSTEIVDTKEADNKWFEGVDKVIGVIQQNKNRITYEFDEKEINVDIDQTELIELRDAMDKPYEWLKDRALNDDGSYDFQKLAHLVLKDMHHDKIVKEAYERGRVDQEQYILSKQRGTSPKAATGAPQNNSDPRDELAAIFKSWK